MILDDGRQEHVHKSRKERKNEREITGGGVEFSPECVGDPKVLRQAVEDMEKGRVIKPILRP